MRFAVLSGAYKNAGDYLIVDRSIKLLSPIYPEAEFLMITGQNLLTTV